MAILLGESRPAIGARAAAVSIVRSLGRAVDGIRSALWRPPEMDGSWRTARFSAARVEIPSAFRPRWAMPTRRGGTLVAEHRNGSVLDLWIFEHGAIPDGRQAILRGLQLDCEDRKVTGETTIFRCGSQTRLVGCDDVLVRFNLVGPAFLSAEKSRSLERVLDGIANRFAGCCPCRSPAT